MLNPKLIELYGEESRQMLNSMIGTLGCELASLCYVVPDDFMLLNDVKIPHSMRVSDMSVRSEVIHKLFEFIDKFTNLEDERAIYVYCSELPKDGDIRLWLCSN